MPMYPNDNDQYKDEIENTFEESYIGDKFSEIKALMTGFLGKKDILIIGKLYLSHIFEQTEKMKGNH